MKIAILASIDSEWQNLAGTLRACYDGENLSISRHDLDEPLYNPPDLDTHAIFAIVDGMASLTAVRKIAAWNTGMPLVLVCKNPDYALEGIRLKVRHYLLQPVTQTDVNEALDRIFNKKRKVMG